MLSVLFRTNTAVGRRELIRLGAIGGLSLAAAVRHGSLAAVRRAVGSGGGSGS